MKKLEKTITQIENDVETFAKKIFGEVKKPVESIVNFVKKHKKILAILAVAYIGFNYLFAETDENEEE